MAKQAVAVNLPDGRRFEVEALGGTDKDGHPKLRLYRMIPHIKGSPLGKDHGGFMTGSYQRRRVPKSSPEWGDVAHYMAEQKRAADRARDWKLRWSWRLGRAFHWVVDLPFRTWRRLRARGHRVLHRLRH